MAAGDARAPSPTTARASPGDRAVQVWFFSGDHGADVVASGGVGQGIVFAHYFRSQPVTHHINAVPYLGVDVTLEAEQTYAAFGERAWHAANAARHLTFFFAGNLALSDTSGGYSEGVRRQLWIHHHALTLQRLKMTR